MIRATPSLTYNRRTLFDAIVTAAVVMAVTLLAGCPPNEAPKYNDEVGTYTVSKARLLGRDNTFSLKDELVYPEGINRGMDTTSLNLTDKRLAEVRCSWCHECGFEEAWDWKNYGSSEWSPRYVGEEWGPIVARMKDKEMSFLQEELIARRIYEYLRDDSLGVYDETADDMGAVRVEVDEMPPQVDTSPVMTPGSGAGMAEPEEPGIDGSETPPGESGGREA